MKKTVIFLLSLLSLLMIITKSYSQITYISGQVNEYAFVSGITTPVCDPCNTSLACVNAITVDDGTIFSVGDRVLIVQMKGASINTTNTSSGGQITDIGNAGNYEFFTIQAISGNDIYPSGQLVKTYDAIGLIQLVKVPNYQNDVEITADLIASPWDRATGKGGIIAIYVEGTLTFRSNINVKGAGYQGIEVTVNGSPDNCSINPDIQFVEPATNTDVCPKGNGVVVDDPTTNGGRSPRANGGGGGGVSGDSGGGGGANYGAGGAGGWRWCDVDGARAGGEGGLSISSYMSDNRMFFGGAGGAGFVTSNNASEASNGGGLVIIHAKHIEGNGFTIDASGDDVATPTGGIDGGGGGGGGGTVTFEIETISGTLNVNVDGGDGQDLATTTPHGPGGGGGGGVCLHNLATLPANIIVTANGGIGGEHLACIIHEC